MSTKINDFASTSRLWPAVGPLASDESVAGDAVDMLDADGPAFAILTVGADVAEATVGLTIQASADGDDWADIDGAVLAPAGAGVRSLTFQRATRFVRAAVSISDAEDPVTFAVVIGQSRKVI